MGNKGTRGRRMAMGAEGERERVPLKGLAAKREVWTMLL